MYIKHHHRYLYRKLINKATRHLVVVRRINSFRDDELRRTTMTTMTQQQQQERRRQQQRRYAAVGRRTVSSTSQTSRSRSLRILQLADLTILMLMTIVVALSCVDDHDCSNSNSNNGSTIRIAAVAALMTPTWSRCRSSSYCCRRPTRSSSGSTTTAIKMGTGNTFGRVFRISTWGESHGGGVGVQVDGCPPRLRLSRDEVQRDLDRRRPGQSRITTPRNEADAVEIMSGLTPDGVTLGTPIAMLVRNKDQRSQDYLDNDMKVAYRPSHADATYDAKYGVRAIAGGGRSSARETIGRVAAGAIAKKILRLYNGIEVLAYVSKVQDIEAVNVDEDAFTVDDVDSNIVRCPDRESADRMLERIDEIRKSGNSIGGVVTCVARNVPAGIGSPVFDKLEADLAKACMSIPAAKGFESGDGFAGTLLTGKEHNDEFYVDRATGATRTRTNRSGGIQGGISNGENIVVHVAFKPTSTIGQVQVRYNGSSWMRQLSKVDNSWGDFLYIAVAGTLRVLFFLDPFFSYVQATLLILPSIYLFFSVLFALPISLIYAKTANTEYRHARRARGRAPGEGTARSLRAT